MKTVLFLLSFSIVVQSMMVTGALNVCVSTIEKLYQYRSFHIAFIDMCYNIGFALSAFTLGYVVTKRKMKWIGLGMFLIFVGCIVFIIPTFIVKNYNVKGIKALLVCSNISDDRPVECHYGTYGFLAIMCSGYMIIGIGAAPLHTIAINVMQENTSPTQGGLFNGIYYTFAALGPALMFVVYSFIIKIPFRIVKDAHDILSPRDEGWVGAYWIVYVMGGALALAISIPIYFFPVNIKYRRSISENAERITIQRFWCITKRVATNKEFILVSMAMFFDGMMNNAIGVFLSKYTEAQFKISSDRAALFSGLIIVIGAAIGLFSGGLLIKIYNWNNRKLILTTALISSIGIFTLFFLFFRCSDNPINGVLPDQNSIKFEKTLAIQCNCNILEYYPVCVDERKSYYSPCSIGCRSQNIQDDGSYTFSNCSTEYVSTPEVIVKQGRCSIACKIIVIFMITAFISLVTEFIMYIPQITYTMRVLDDETRLCGLSLQQIFVRISYMIGPVYQGKFFDWSCTIFAPTVNCSNTSNCIDYDLKNLSFSFAIPAIAQKFLATMCLFLAVYFSKKELRIKAHEMEVNPQA
ncbi:Solute carrier organic anion transporter family member 4A1 [Thelohanellus kitauei]|uniref:Solute carrier organic anion transporter family member 4A1 n=1 Tax=Thelohanellus kitauei TaxID=669202 RepID=A0A0C2M3R1_THEKT|nr:Solute carrier organic anion transporter family member 4A1 [Thelohanellus kitauei]